MLSNSWLPLGVGVLIIVLIVVSYLKFSHLGRIDRELASEQHRVAQKALEKIERNFEKTLQRVVQNARSVAEDPEIVEALERYTFDADPASQKRLLQRFASFTIDPEDALELYTVAPRLVSWKGFSMPIGEAPLSSQFAYNVQYEVVRDRGVWEAVAVWHPVRYEGRVIGAVRAMHLVGVKMPVENQYLKSYSLSDNWRRLTLLPVRVEMSPEGVLENETGQDEGILHVLHDLDGNIAGKVFVPFLSRDELETQISNRYSDVQAFLVLLIVLLLVSAQVRKLSAWWKGDKDVNASSGIRGIMQFTMLSIVWWGLRFSMVYLDIPSRWQRGKAPLSPLFDPTHFASDYGGGLFRSIGDMLITGIFLLFFAVWFFRFLQGVIAAWEADKYHANNARGWRTGVTVLRTVMSVIASIGFMVFSTHVLGNIVFRSVIDSTLDYSERSGILPDRLVFLMFCTLMLIGIAWMILNVGVSWGAVVQVHAVWRRRKVRNLIWGGIIALCIFASVGYFSWYNAFYMAPLPVVLGISLVCWSGCIIISEYPAKMGEWLHFRGALLGILLLAVPLYALLEKGMDAHLRNRMVEAAGSFDSREDPSVVFAIGELLNDARLNKDLSLAVANYATEHDTLPVEPIVEKLFRVSSLSSLLNHDVSVTIFDTTSTRIEHFDQRIQGTSNAFIDGAELDEFRTLKLMYEESGSDSVLVDILTGRYESEQFQHGGIGPIYHPDTSLAIGWFVARAEKKALQLEEGTLFPKVLLPYGVSQLQGNLSLAYFQGDVLLRTLGADFGQYRMQEDIYDQLKLNDELWHSERKGDKEFLSYYKRTIIASPSVTSTPVTSITAVRTSRLNLFDHLFYTLRLVIAGICIGGPLYVFMRFFLVRSRLRAQYQLRYKDRVLNAFLGVGVVTVILVGVSGLQVITNENNSAIRSWIREHLSRVEEYLSLNAEFGELPAEVLDRIDLDVISDEIGMDVNVYSNSLLDRTSSEQLVEDRLIDERLPVEAYYQLFYEGNRHAYAQQQVGDFKYTAGYRVLSDRQGQPRYVISVPTLPEQERIEEERARTVAYLFGALLLLVIAVMLTASLLANALSRPIGRLREGLEAVARGRFERPLPVDTRDEIGELVQTFNAMQAQLADSRRKLAQQERQLAWREMARQVAHEIKNPLTPMKLSVQHLRRAYSNGSPQTDYKFRNLFEKITTTLIEQVDALARIANEFSSFARMPKRLLEPLDLNMVVREAVDLMQEQMTNNIEVDLFEEPLVLHADREELRRIYINLIKNAIEASSHKALYKIRVTSTREGGTSQWAYSTVEDEGTGIAAEMVDKIFEPNFSSKTSGTGLGLAIVKKSIEDLQGEIGFQTEEQKGTTFWIKLPLIED